MHPIPFNLVAKAQPFRSNIANAKIQGMDEDLHLHGNQYNMAVMVFTLAYVIFGVPANLIFKKFGPQSLSVMMFVWGKVHPSLS